MRPLKKSRRYVCDGDNDYDDKAGDVSSDGNGGGGGSATSTSSPHSTQTRRRSRKAKSETELLSISQQSQGQARATPSSPSISMSLSVPPQDQPRIYADLGTLFSLVAPDGREFKRGDIVTIDGSHGDVYAG